jgi:hypothetical protein
MPVTIYRASSPAKREGPSIRPRPRIPAKVSQYVDLMRFSKQGEGWLFQTQPSFYESLQPLVAYKWTYRFTVVVAGDGATPQTKFIYVDYDGDWKTATPYE